LAGCLAPAVGGGCFTTHPAHGPAADPLLAHAEQGIERAIRRDAREAWREVRGQYPRKVFTAEFRDGFLDGYADYLDRGGTAQPPAVPPPRYTRNKKYFTPEGHALIRDYFLGFQYGVDVAVATGQRQYLTVPVLIPEGHDLPPVVPAAAPAAPAVIPPTPVPLSTAAPPAVALPAPRPLVPTPAAPPKGGTAGHATPAPPSLPPALVESKFPPAPRIDDGPAVPTLPAVPPPVSGVIAVPALPSGEAIGTTFPAGTPLQVGIPKLDFPVKLPEPPTEVPSLPTHVPTPPMTDDLPVIPPNHTVPPPLPANHPDDVRK
jgi:hypothetical protein